MAGFTASFELKGTAKKEKSNTSSQTSVASNITTNNFKIKAKNKATIQGSNITANSGEIDAKTIEVLASEDKSKSSSSSKTVEVTASIDTTGDISNTEGNVSGSQSNSSSTTYNNSNLNFNNLKLTSKEDTIIKGASVNAAQNLDVNVGGNLSVESVQNTNRNSSGSLSIGSEGTMSASMSKSKEKTTVLTTLSGKNVNVYVENNTNLKGALIESSQEDGVSLDTGTLTTSNLSNTKSSRNVSLGGSAGSTVSGNLGMGSQNSKSKTLATITSGTINVRDTENSTDIAKLNRNKDDINLDLYDVKSDVKISAEVDTNMLTKKGRTKIADDMKVTKVGFYDVAKDIITKDSLSIMDSFKHQGNKVGFYDGVQKAIKNSKTLQEKLANPNLTKEQKNEVLREIATSVAKELKIKLSDVSTVASNSKTKDEKYIQGAYHEESGDIAINDTANSSTGETLNSLGNEMSHLLDTKRGEKREGTTSNGESFKDEYSNLMGDSLEDYANFGMYNYTDDKTLANTNTHNGLTPPKSVFSAGYDEASGKFEDRNAKGELEYRGLRVSDFPGAKNAQEVGNSIATAQAMGMPYSNEQLINIYKENNLNGYSKDITYNNLTKEGLVDGISIINKASYPAAVVSGATGNVPAATFFVGAGYATDYLLYKFDEKSEQSIYRETTIDSLPIPGWKGEVTKTGLKVITNNLEKKGNKK